MNAGLRPQGARPDHRLIAELVEPGSRLLDIGCGDGALLELLAREKNVDGRGIEISQEGVNASVRRGLSVIQGDAETDLADYPDTAFDYVVLSQTSAGDPRPQGRAAGAAQDRPERDRVHPQFRALAQPAASYDPRPHAAGAGAPASSGTRRR